MIEQQLGVTSSAGSHHCQTALLHSKFSPDWFSRVPDDNHAPGAFSPRGRGIRCGLPHLPRASFWVCLASQAVQVSVTCVLITT